MQTIKSDNYRRISAEKHLTCIMNQIKSCYATPKSQGKAICYCHLDNKKFSEKYHSILRFFFFFSKIL